MSIAEVFAPVDAVYRDEVLSNTWGHLYPEPGKKYHGYLIFTLTGWGNIVPIDKDFEGLDDSPWFFDDMTDFIGKKVDIMGDDDYGCVFLFKGYYIRFKNQNYRFSGKVEKLKLI